jgi:flagellar motor switch protein FliG
MVLTTTARPAPASAVPEGFAFPVQQPDDPLDGVSGLERVAALLVGLGQEVSAEVLKHLPEKEIERVTYQIFRLRQCPAPVLDRVMERAQEELLASGYVSTGGVAYVQELLTRAMGASRAQELIGRLFARGNPSLFDFLQDADPLQLVNLIEGEHPQMIALILAHLPPKQGALVLTGLSPEVQREVAIRMAQMDRTAPHVIKEVDRLIRHKAAAFATHEFQSTGGVKQLVDLLNQTDNKSQKAILEQLETADPGLAESVRSSMFTFEDVHALADADMIKVVRELDNKDLALALRGVKEDLREKFRRGMSTRAWEQLAEDIELLGPQRLSTIEEAQQKVVQAIRRLVDSEEIVLAIGGGEELR